MAVAAVVRLSSSGPVRPVAGMPVAPRERPPLTIVGRIGDREDPCGARSGGVSSVAGHVANAGCGAPYIRGTGPTELILREGRASHAERQRPRYRRPDGRNGPVSRRVAQSVGEMYNTFTINCWWLHSCCATYRAWTERFRPTREHFSIQDEDSVLCSPGRIK